MPYDLILKCLAEILELDFISLKEMPHTTKLSDFDVSSVLFIQLIVKLENTFSLKIDDSDLLMEKFQTIGIMFDTLRRYFQENQQKKCLILDCDDLLWTGIAGEETIFLTDENMDFQNLVAELQKKGVLICLCSKNEAENITEVFENTEMPLKPGHIIITKANRNNKAENIRRISDELNLSLDSFVFIDDSGYEVGLVQSVLPDVLSIKADFTNPEFIPYLKSLFNLSDINSNRTRLYKEQLKREREKQRYNTVEEYNLNLNTNITCGTADRNQADRISELSRRTNQFNLSNRRYSVDEVRMLIESSDYMVMYLSAADRYGDMGMVSAAVINIAESKAIIEARFLSCRVLGRGFEDIITDKIKALLYGRSVAGVYMETTKNKSFKDFYKHHGISKYEL